MGGTFFVNGRTYGVHDGTLYPVSGSGLYTFDRGGCKALGVFNKFGNTPQANDILNKMGVSSVAKKIRARGVEKGWEMIDFLFVNFLFEKDLRDFLSLAFGCHKDKLLIIDLERFSNSAS